MRKLYKESELIRVHVNCGLITYISENKGYKKILQAEEVCGEWLMIELSDKDINELTFIEYPVTNQTINNITIQLPNEETEEILND